MSLPNESKTPSSPAEGQRNILRNGVLVVAILLVLGGLLYSAVPERCHRNPLEFALKAFALRYHLFYAEHGRAPTNLQELDDYTPANPEELTDIGSYDGTLAIDRVRRGEIVVFWNAKFFPSGDKNNEYILGYETSVPTDGGYIVRGGGSVSRVSADEFATMVAIPTATDIAAENGA